MRRQGWCLIWYLAALAGLVAFSDFQSAGRGLWFAVCGIMGGASYLALLRAPVAIDARWFWVVAVAARFVLVFAQPGDDVWRFLWEGKIQWHGWNPYIHAPAAPELASLRDDLWSRINHPDWATIYPPLAEFLFRLVAPTGVAGFKAMAILGDLGTIVLLLRLLRNDYAAVAWYAWNPLVVYLFAGAAHFDSCLLAATLGAILILERGQQRPALVAAGSLLFGVAIAIKLIPVLLLPACLVALRRRWYYVLFAAVVPLGFSFLYGFPQFNPWSNVMTFGQVTRTNDLIWWFWEHVVPNVWQNNRVYNTTLIIVVLLVTWQQRRDWRKAMLAALAVALVLSPALHPWYVSWILPLAAWFRARAWFVLSVSVFAYFSLTSDSILGPAWQQPWWHHLVVGLPPLTWFLAERCLPVVRRFVGERRLVRRKT
jgi:hypothetical protein